MVPRSLGSAVALPFLLVLASCTGPAEDERDEQNIGPEGCTIGETPTPDGGCCPAGARLMETGECIPAGIPPEACGDGFMSDEVGGCEPILPAAACPSGQMALPGEDACRAVGPCGEGTWGDIPLDGNVVFVDQNAGGAGDGSQASPFTGIQAAINLAAPGATIAVAAGSYAEDLTITKAVQLRGRCAEMVEITGAGGIATLLVQGNSTGVVVSDLAVTSGSYGVIVSAAVDVVLERLWIHDTGNRGLDIENFLGPAAVTLVGSLVESARDAGVIVLGSSLTMRDSVVRDTQMLNNLGRGVVVKRALEIPDPSWAAIEHSVIANNHNAGVLIEVSEVTIDDSVIRDSLPDQSQAFGRGIEVQSDIATGEPSSLTLRRSVVERHFDSGVLADGCHVLVEHSVIRDIAPGLGGQSGAGFELQIGAVAGATGSARLAQSVITRTHSAAIATLGTPIEVDRSILRDIQAGLDPEFPDVGTGVMAHQELSLGVRAVAAVLGSVVQNTVSFGMHVQGSDAAVDQTLIVDVAASPTEKRWGHGIEVVDGGMSAAGATLFVGNSVIERATDVGLANAGGEMTVQNVVVRDVRPRAADGASGQGIGIQRATFPALGFIRDSLVDGANTGGIIFFDGSGSVERTTVRDVVPDASGGFGDGVAVVFGQGVTIAGVRIEDVSRAGVAAFSADVGIQDSTIACNPIALTTQDILGKASVENLGGNDCSCDGDDTVCKVLAAELEPPTPSDFASDL